MKHERRIHHYSGSTDTQEGKSKNVTVTIMARPTAILSKRRGYFFLEFFLQSNSVARSRSLRHHKTRLVRGIVPSKDFLTSFHRFSAKGLKLFFSGRG